jgi:hypothetical protein
MPDLLIRGIEEDLAERIKNYARDRGMTINASVLELIGGALSTRPTTASSARMTELAEGDAELRVLGGSWSSDEARAFREAIGALESLKE